MLISNHEFKNYPLILQVCIVVFFISTSAAFVACATLLAKMGEDLSAVSTSALFILLGIQNLLSLISGFSDGAFLLLGRGKPLIRHEVSGSKGFRRLVLANSFFVTIALLHIYFTYLKPV